MNKQIRSKAIAAGATIFWLIVWQIAATVVNRGLLIPIPTPVSTAAALVRIITDAESLTAVGLSVLRILAGFVCALIAGTILAVLSARFTLFRVLTAPLVQLIRAIPVASFTILLFLWVSRGKLPSTIAFFTVLPVVWANVSAGLAGIDPQLMELAQVYRLPRSRVLRRIIVPSVLPHLRAALRSALGLGWKAGIAAEVLTVPPYSIGKRIYEAKLYLETTELFAWTAAVVLVSLLIEGLLLRLTDRLGQKENGHA